MTICRKCGKEIPDGEELCEDCKSQASNSGESYLDDLMKSMEIPESDPGRPELTKKSVMAEEMPAAEPAVAEPPVVESPASEPPVAEPPVVESPASEPPVAESPVTEPEEEELPDPVMDDMIMAAEEEPETETEELLDLVLNDILTEEEPEVEESEAEEPVEEEPELPDFDLGDIAIEEPEAEEPAAEEPVEEEAEEEEPELPELDLGDIAIEEPEAEEPVEEEPVVEDLDISATDISDESMPEDINDLLDLLSKDYSEEEMDAVDEEIEEESDIPAAPVVQDVSSPEISLFSDDEGDAIFAEDVGTSVEDIFQDALSAVDDIDDEEDSDDDLDDVFALEGDFDPEGEDSPDEKESSEAENVVPLAKPVQKKAKKPGFWKRIFGNIVTDQTAEEEAREREQEKEQEAERAAAKEEKAKQAAVDKEEKEAAAQEEKEKKAALKAEQAAAKAAAKEEKKKRKAELAAVEVVGKINPVGATIVMVFFGLICVAVIFGTQSLSYTSALNNARKEFEARNYESAYEALAGVNVSESSQEMADKIRICMQLQKELNSYSNYYEMKMYLESLDSLMKGIRSYDTNKNKADEYEINKQYDELKAKITSALFSEFGVSETEARTTNGMQSQEEYTAKLEEIIRRWEAKNAQDER